MFHYIFNNITNLDNMICATNGRIDFAIDLALDNNTPLYNEGNISIYQTTICNIIINKIEYHLHINSCVINTAIKNNESIINSYIIANAIIPKPCEITIFSNNSAVVNGIPFTAKFGNDNISMHIYAKFVNDTITEINPLQIKILTENSWVFIKGINSRNNIIEYYCIANIKYVDVNNNTTKTENLLVKISYDIGRNSCSFERLNFNLLESKPIILGKSILNNTTLIDTLEVPIDLDTSLVISFDYKNNKVVFGIVNNQRYSQNINEYKLKSGKNAK